MTPEREAKIDALIARLKHCQAECDEMMENASDATVDRLENAICNTEETIYQLEKITE